MILNKLKRYAKKKIKNFIVKHFLQLYNTDIINKAPETEYIPEIDDIIDLLNDIYNSYRRL